MLHGLSSKSTFPFVFLYLFYLLVVLSTHGNVQQCTQSLAYAIRQRLHDANACVLMEFEQIIPRLCREVVMILDCFCVFLV